MLQLSLLLVSSAIAVQAIQDNGLALKEMADALSILRKDLSAVQNENFKMAQELMLLYASSTLIYQIKREQITQTRLQIIFKMI